MGKKERCVPHFTDVSYYDLTPKRAREIFNTQAIFHPERDIRCILKEENGRSRSVTFNPRFIVRDRKDENAAVEQMTRASQVNIIFSHTKHIHHTRR